MGQRPCIPWYPLPAVGETGFKRVLSQLLVNSTVPRHRDEAQERPNSQGFHNYQVPSYFSECSSIGPVTQGNSNAVNSLEGELPKIHKHLKVLAKKSQIHIRLGNGGVLGKAGRETESACVCAYVCVALGGCLEDPDTPECPDELSSLLRHVPLPCHHIPF